MPKGKLKVSANWSNFSNTLNKKLEEINKQVKEIAQDSETIAQTTIILGSLDPNFTQKHGMELANYITTEKTSNGYQVTAGANAPPEILYELYYAEYGAGVDKIESFMPSAYTPHNLSRLPFDESYWIYPTLTGNYAITDTSIPLEYMKTARNYAKAMLTNLKSNTKKKITTSIKRGVKNAIEK